MTFGIKNYLDNIRQRLPKLARLVSDHDFLIGSIVFILLLVGWLAFDFSSIYDSIPDLPTGPLQMVGVYGDGARFVVLKNHGFAKGANLISFLSVFYKPMHLKQGTFRFWVNRESVNCSKHQIELHGAAWYDDQGRQTISRVFDPKPQPFKPIDAETTLVCDHEHFAIPKVIGYRAALAQTLALASRGHFLSKF